MEPRILVAEDFAAMREIIGKMLADAGAPTVHEAHNGLSALTRLGSERFDLLITGLDMPDMDGVALVRQVRARPGLENLPILMISAEVRRERIVEAVEAGVDAYLVKPFTFEQFSERLEMLLGATLGAAQ